MAERISKGRGGRLISGLMVDFDGVILRKETERPGGEGLLNNILRLVSDKSGATGESAKAEWKRLLAKHNTNESAIAMQREFGMSALEFTERVHVPEISNMGRHTFGADTEFLDMMRELNMPKVILTNSSERFVSAALSAIGARGEFAEIIGVERLGLQMKPGKGAYEKAMALSGFTPEETAYFDDNKEMLRVPVEMQMVAVWITGREVPEEEYRDNARNGIYPFGSLASALKSIKREGRAYVFDMRRA